LCRAVGQKARQRGIYALGAGPVGFSTVWVICGPNSMTFDRYFDLSDEMDQVEKFVAYVAGMAPASLQRSYMDLAYLDVPNRTGPSAGLACHLASGVVAAEVVVLVRGQQSTGDAFDPLHPDGSFVGVVGVARTCPTCRFFRSTAEPNVAASNHCALLDMPLRPGDLRLDCPEHEPAAA
jgi:hypothetical protein